MRSHMMRCSLIALLFALTCGSASHAAITEKYCLNGINDTVAVLRYYHRLATDAQYNIDLCRAAKALTQQQLNQEKALLDDANLKLKEATDAHDDEKIAQLTWRADFYKRHVTRLTHQLARLAEFNYEKAYAERIKESSVQLVKRHAELDGRIAEYELLFGKPAHAQTNFTDEMAKYRPHRENMAYFLILD